MGTESPSPVNSYFNEFISHLIELIRVLPLVDNYIMWGKLPCDTVSEQSRIFVQ